MSPSDPRDSGARSGADLEALVRAEQVHGLYAKGPMPYVASFVNAGLVAFVLWDRLDHARLVAWLVLVCALQLPRLALHRAYHVAKPPASEAPRWGRRFVVGAFANGVAWGAGGVLLYAPDAASQLLLTFVIAGMCAGASSSTATYAPAFPAFSAPALLPITARLFASGEKLQLAMGSMLALFGVAMTSIARAGGKSLTESARLRFKNAALASDLADARAGLEDRVRARTAELGAQKETLQKVFDHVPVMLQICDEDGVVHRINPELEQRLGWSLDEHRAPDVAAAVFPGGAPACDASGPTRWRDYTSRAKNGAARATTWAAVVLSDGMVIRIGSDVTERRRAQEALAVAERMASLGTLAAGIAHEINNPLSFCLANHAFLREHLASLEGELSADARAALGEAQAALADAQNGADRVRAIVADLRTLARESAEPDRPMDLVPVLEAALRIATSELRPRARVETDFGRVPRVVGSEPRLGQVFLNLLSNAAEAIPEGADTRDHLVRVVARTAEDGSALVEVSDTGSGIAPDVLPRIFDPFFTTKPIGHGMGLGLSICHGIVTSLGGRIDVTSAPGRGTLFRVSLPAAEPAALDAARSAE